MNAKQKILQIILFVIFLAISWFLLALIPVLIFFNQPNDAFFGFRDSVLGRFLLGGGAVLAIRYSWKLSKRIVSKNV